MKMTELRAKIRTISNHKYFIWAVRACGWIVGSIETHLIMFHREYFWKNLVLSFVLFGALGLTEYKVKYKEMSDLKRVAVVGLFFVAYCVVTGIVYLIGCPNA